MSLNSESINSKREEKKEEEGIQDSLELYWSMRKKSQA